MVAYWLRSGDDDRLSEPTEVSRMSRTEMHGARHGEPACGKENLEYSAFILVKTVKYGSKFSSENVIMCDWSICTSFL